MAQHSPTYPSVAALSCTHPSVKALIQLLAPPTCKWDGLVDHPNTCCDLDERPATQICIRQLAFACCFLAVLGRRCARLQLHWDHFQVCAACLGRAAVMVACQPTRRPRALHISGQGPCQRLPASAAASRAAAAPGPPGPPPAGHQWAAPGERQPAWAGLKEEGGRHQEKSHEAGQKGCKDVTNSCFTFAV